MGNVWFFYFTPKTTFSNGGSSNGGNTSVPTGGGVVNGGGVINDGTDGAHATNCEWLALNGYWMLIVQWVLTLGLSLVMCCCQCMVSAVGGGCYRGGYPQAH